MKKMLIIQGGGFRTSFSAGVIDAFIRTKHNDFDAYIGVSGGAMALSYYLSEQHRFMYESMCYLAKHKSFVRYTRLMSPTGMIDINLFHDVAKTEFPFDVTAALKNVESKELAFVMTDMETGEAHYYSPNKKTWIDSVIASCTMPFVTKGKHILDNRHYMDGGWSDPLPVIWGYENGAREIVFIRTVPENMKISQSWSDYFGSFLHASNHKVRACFEENHLIYNKAIDFMENPPHDLKLTQIAPESPLMTGTYSYSIEAINADYEHGLSKGLEFIERL